jgi:hypothetical protein
MRSEREVEQELFSVNHKLIILGALPEEEELLTSPSPLSDFI